MKVTKEKAAEAVQGIEEAEVHLLTTTEYDELLENFKKTTIESELKSRIAKVYDDVDKDFLDATGLKKPDDVKTYKYWPTVVKQFKDKAEQLAVELETLKKTASPELAKELESLRKAAQENDAEWKSKYAMLQGELATKDIKNILNSSTAGLKLANLPKPVIDTFIESAKSKLAATAKLVDGELVFMDKNGEVLTNKETFKPFTASELMAIELEPVIEKEDKKGGGTQPPKFQKDKDGKLDISINVPATVTNRVELTKFLIEKVALPLNTPEFKIAYDKYSDKLPSL